MKKILLVLTICLSHFCVVIAQEDSVKTKSLKFSAYPALGSSPETGFVFGAISFFVWKNKSQKEGEFYRPTSISPYLVYTAKNQFLSKIDVDIFLKNGVNINGDFRYLNFPNKFFGIGNEVDPEISESFTNEFARINGRIMKPRSQNLYLGLLYDLQYNSITSDDPSGLLAQGIVNGTSGGFNIGIGPSLLLDSRNSTLYPSSGRFLNVGVTAFTKFLGSQYSYTSFVVDYREFHELLGPKNIIGFQFRANLNSGSDVPFYKLNRLGGDARLRGVEHKNLYISRQSMFFQTEVRQELFWRFGGVIFAGMGEIFDSFSDFGTKDLRFIYGIGGRFQALKDEKLNIRLDLGFTDNGQNAIYLSVREAF